MADPAVLKLSTHPYVAALAAAEGLTTIEQDILTAVGAASPEDVHGLLMAFPSLAGMGLRLPAISSAVMMSVSASYAAEAAPTVTPPPSPALGAEAPEDAAFAPGTTVTLDAFAPVLTPGAAAPPAPPPAAGTILPGAIWPVRNQGQRGTCVAHGTTACVEFNRFAAEGANPDYAEQFLYWAIKDHSGDPQPAKDGTWLQYAQVALRNDGVCAESLWPYVSTPVAPVSGAAPPDPTTAAIAAAAARRTASTYLKKPTGAAATLVNLLAAGRPVAISLPVFADPTMPRGPTNWTTNVGTLYGRILNPPPSSVAVGGHCVCVVGFVPDATEPNGGWFVVRNSWDTSWARLAPAAGGYNSPASGYGDLSATYVELFCWELLQL